MRKETADKNEFSVEEFSFYDQLIWLIFKQLSFTLWSHKYIRAHERCAAHKNQMDVTELDLCVSLSPSRRCKGDMGRNGLAISL